VLIASHDRWALLHELRGAAEPPLSELLTHMSPVDLVLVEGFKHGAHPKLEVRRRDSAGAMLADRDPHIVAIATDGALTAQTKPVFALDDVAGIADFILQA